MTSKKSLKRNGSALNLKTLTNVPAPALHRLIRDMSSEGYHGSPGSWSSSQLKDIIEDEEIFIQKYIKKTIPREEREAFDTGTYLHTGTLEAHKVATEIAVFPGKVRYGANWDLFKKKNKGKTIITERQKAQGDGMISVIRKSPICMGYLDGEPEVSLFTELLVFGGEIFAPNWGKKLTPDGWVKSNIPKKGRKFIIKVRADCMGETFISDIKSTSSRATHQGSIRNAISKYKYDLSAALYLDMFALIRSEITAFIWVFASKENPCAASWLATKNQIRVGRAKWSWALKRLSDLADSDWEIPDYLREVEPLPYELEWLQQSETDLL